MRPRVSVTFNTTPRKTTLIYEAKGPKLSTISSQISKQERDETDTRLSKRLTYETRPRRDWLNLLHPRQDRNETDSIFCLWGETETRQASELWTRPRVSVLLVSRPRRDQDSRHSLTDGQMDIQTDILTYRQMDRWTDRWMDRRTKLMY